MIALVPESIYLCVGAVVIVLSAVALITQCGRRRALVYPTDIVAGRRRRNGDLADSDP